MPYLEKKESLLGEHQGSGVIFLSELGDVGLEESKRLLEVCRDGVPELLVIVRLLHNNNK